MMLAALMEISRIRYLQEMYLIFCKEEWLKEDYEKLKKRQMNATVESHKLMTFSV